jgi:alkyldihydroxyacetonephosphate synthase
MEHVQTRWNGWGRPGHDDPLATNEPAWRWLAQAFAMPALLATPPRELWDIALPPSQLPDAARQKLIALLGEQGIRRSDFERARHAAGRGLCDLLRLRSGDLSTAPDAVLYPRTEADVGTLLKFCAETDIAVIPFGGGAGDIPSLRGSHRAVVALNLSALNRVTLVDMVSGLAEAQAGIMGPELERQLNVRGMMLGHRPDDFEFSSLGGWIAQPGANQEATRYGEVEDWLAGLRVATPQGFLTPSGLPDLRHLILGSRGALGVITRATIRLRAVAQKEEHRAYLFPDFASGLAVLRETQRIGLPHAFLRLSDDGRTRLLRALETAGEDADWARRLFAVYLSVRRFDGSAARLVAGFAGSEEEVTWTRKHFDGLAKRLGALSLGRDAGWKHQRYAAGYRRDTLLDRGVSMDRLELWANWAALPSLYLAVRAALKQAMRSHAPRAGAHGLVLCEVGPARIDGATLTFTWLYPRILEDGLNQAEAIRRAGLNAAQTAGNGPKDNGRLAREALIGVKCALDPKAILNPGVMIP